ERDCSLQRRHQKVIEEAPAPGMTDQMRAAMGAAAVAAARAVDYAGAGTVEFIVDASGGLVPERFWFMEMNTRLQVEHPVTEAVTGIDLVEWQLRVAAGEPLPCAQEDIRLAGHAIEARLYAEDPANGFLPVTGTLNHMKVPPGCRLETGVRTGDAISPFYDPMIAKIVTSGHDRQTALLRMERTLEGTQIAGLVTNLDFLGRLVRLPEFRAAELDTGLIARARNSLAIAPEPSLFVKMLGAVAALGLDEKGDWQTGFTLWEPMAQDVTLAHDGEDFTARITTLAGGRFNACLGQTCVLLETSANGWRVDGAKVAASFCRHGTEISVFSGGTWNFELRDPLDRNAFSTASGDLVLSPMPGLVRRVDVNAGDAVEPGAPLLVLEAMKMEHILSAERDGQIAEVLVGVGTQVASGEPLVRFSAGED
ncbi:MAG: biotin/lipoyl-containing protein, partial [Paracoccaceae bacterium]